MKLTDLLAIKLKQNKIERIHAVTGGGVVHILDSAKSNGILPVFYQNEQAASFGAVGESKQTKGISCCVVTTGPGGTNAVTGLVSAWTDSIPLLFISGQARLEHLSSKTGVRQLGTQEIDIISIVKSVTKMALTLENIDNFDLLIQELVSTANEGRPGPVWLDLPINFQWADIPPPLNHVSAIIKHPYNSYKKTTPKIDTVLSSDLFAQFLEAFNTSLRPAFLIGGGVSIQSKLKLISWLRLHAYPYALTYNSLGNTDCRNDSMNFGVVGIAGRRSANALIYNCDNLIVLGTHLPLPLTGALTQKWCSQAIKTIVNIDSHELEVTRLNFNYKFSLDASIFIDQLCSIGGDKTPKPSQEWRRFCHDLAQVCEPSFTPPSPFIDQYKFLKILSDHLHQHDVVTIDGGGTINASAFTTLRPYSSTSLIMSSGMCAMGSGIPEAIGACMSCKSSGARFILLIGDGSLQFNIQELATVYFLKIPLKIFIINNAGYSSIRITQKQFLENRQIGVSEDSGIYLPSLKKIADLYHFNYQKLESTLSISNEIEKILLSDAPVLVEVMVHPEQPIGPTQGFRKNDDGTFSPSPLYAMNPPLNEVEEQLLTKWIQ